MRNKHIWLSHTAMTPAERRAGRFLRAPDGHPDGGAAPAAPAAAPEAPAAPETPAAPEPAAAPSTDELYDQEFGGGVAPEGAGAGEGDENPEGVPAPEPDARDAELEALRIENARLKATKAPEPKPGDTPTDDGKPSQAAGDKAPNPDDYEYGEADSKFIADFTRWNVRAEMAQARQQESLQHELTTIESTWKQAAEAPEIAAEYPDFVDKVTTGAANGAWDCSPLMALAIKSSDVGPHVAYHLATHPEESKQIAGLVPIEQALAIGRLEGRYASKAAPATPPAPARMSSKAPAPPEQRSRGAGGQYQTTPDAVYDKMLREF